ncbi:MAG: glycosyltransferase family 8 protein [Rickettsiales bacterium]|jgi:lipopolysaccharide biosynthesis glycosyltransferase|nr:glycosyltransferase family 8 protein [Rickettsiales bacterium]
MLIRKLQCGAAYLATRLLPKHFRKSAFISFITPNISFRHERPPLKKDKPIDVAFCFDKNLVKYAAVLITSLVDVSKGRCDYSIHCVVDKTVDEEDKSLLQGLTNGDSTLNFLEANDDFGRSVRNKWPVSVYYRLMLPKLLPKLDRIIYADIDAVFVNDLVEASVIDLKNYLVAGVPNKDQKDYINSGFLIMNLKQIRRENIYEKWIKASNAESLKYPDQDVLNLVCKNRIYFLPRKYNFSPKDTFRLILHADACSEKDFSDLKYHTVFVHFHGNKKPWQEKKLYLSHIWQYYADKTGLF